jgi:hypothetical protein
MSWNLQGRYAFGIQYEGKTGLSTSKFSWAA